MGENGDETVSAQVNQMEALLRDALRPFTEPQVAAKKPVYEGMVDHPKYALTEIKELKAFPTGMLFDQLFLNDAGKPIGGVPHGAQLALTGLPGAGKSIIIEEIAIQATNMGKKVLLILSEDIWQSATERMDLQSRMANKTKLLGRDWEKVQKNLFVLDAVSHTQLREWNTLAEVYRYIVEKEGIDLVLIDSLTLLETYRGALKYRVMELMRFNQIRGVTAIMVNQRATEEFDQYNMAGGIGLPHNLDGTIIIDIGRVYHTDLAEDMGEKRGAMVRFVRVLDSRLSNFDTRHIRVTIEQGGLVRPWKESEGGSA